MLQIRTAEWSAFPSRRSSRLTSPRHVVDDGVKVIIEALSSFSEKRGNAVTLQGSATDLGKIQQQLEKSE